MCTILDAHPKIAMSYELYLNLLDNQPPINIADLLSTLSDSRNLSRAAKNVTDPKLTTFLIRCERGGLELGDIKHIFTELSNTYSQVDSDVVRGEIISRCCITKMRRKGSTIWGAKCNNNTTSYAELFPGARFIYVVRDGRDMLASQMTTGSFNPDAEKLAISWSKTYQKFKALSDLSSGSTKVVRYEDLVVSPEQSINDLCDFLDIELSTNMLNHNKQDLTIFKASHLSKKQVMKPIDSSRIGRWKSILNDSTVNCFTENAKETLEELNYI